MVTPYASVSRLWPGDTIVCVASGPSLCVEDVEACRGRARVIAVKDAVQLVPWADVLYGTGHDTSRWWALHGPRLQAFAGARYSLDLAASAWTNVLRMTGPRGLEAEPDGLRHGHHSGYAAVNLAVHLGAARIVLLGYDTGHSPHGQKYFFGDRAEGQVSSPFARFIEAFTTIVQPLTDLGIEVINASRVSALTMFPQQPIAEVLG